MVSRITKTTQEMRPVPDPLLESATADKKRGKPQMITYVPDSSVPVTVTRQNSLAFRRFCCKILYGMRTDVVGMKGGDKQFWIRNHYKEIEQYLFEKGPDATMLEFNMRPNTFRRFVNCKHHEPNLSKLSESDRWVSRVAKQGTADLRGRILELEEFRQKAEPIINLLQAFIDATSEQIRLKVEKSPLPDEEDESIEMGGSWKIE